MKPPTISAEGFTWPVRIYWEDTDAGGIVFYANYLKFFERSRTEWLRAKGISQQHLRDTVGGMFVVSDAKVRYIKSAKLDDELLVTTSLQEAGRASMTIHQEARLHHDGESTLLCSATIRASWVDSVTLKPGRIPLQILHALT